MGDRDDREREELRKALNLAICKICIQEDRKQHARTTQAAISALTELTFQYARHALIPDLYTFSSHANRKSTITADDVALVLRKLPPHQMEQFRANYCKSGKNTYTTTAVSGITTATSESNNKRFKNRSPRPNKTQNKSVRGKRPRSDPASPLLSTSSSSEDNNEDNGTTTLYSRSNRFSASHEARKSIGSTTNRSNHQSSERLGTAMANETLAEIFQTNEVDHDDSSEIDVAASPQRSINPKASNTSALVAVSSAPAAVAATTAAATSTISSVSKNLFQRVPPRNTPTAESISNPAKRSLKGFSSSSSCSFSSSSSSSDDNDFRHNHGQKENSTPNPIRTNAITTTTSGVRKNANRHSQSTVVKSQVQETIDNLSTDSGMDPTVQTMDDEDDDENLFFGVVTRHSETEATTSLPTGSITQTIRKRRRRAIQSDEEEEFD